MAQLSDYELTILLRDLLGVPQGLGLIFAGYKYLFDSEILRNIPIGGTDAQIDLLLEYYF